MNHSSTVSFLCHIANLICDHFRGRKYLDVIMPFSRLRRIDRILADSKEKVLAANGRYYVIYYRCYFAYSVTNIQLYQE
jgi:type I restriction-modification system DNA methylase subunit